MDDRQHDLRVVEVVLQDIPDRQRVVHRLQQPHRDRMKRLLELGLAVEEKLIRCERVFELERGVLRVHRHQNGQQLLQTGRHFIRNGSDQKEHGVELIEKRVAPRGAPNRLLICPSHTPRNPTPRVQLRDQIHAVRRSLVRILAQTEHQPRHHLPDRFGRRRQFRGVCAHSPSPSLLSNRRHRIFASSVISAASLQLAIQR